jgi:putative oxidoreductase
MRRGTIDMQDNIATVILAAGRILLGGLFVTGGIRHLFILVPVTNAIEARGIPYAKFVLLAGTAFQLIAGAILMAGIAVAAVAFGLVLFTIAASMMLLDFWNMEGSARDGAINGWQSNMAVIGGLLIAAAGAM